MTALPRRTPHLALYREIKAAHRRRQYITVWHAHLRPVTSR